MFMSPSRFGTSSFLFCTILLLMVVMPWAQSFATVTTVGEQAQNLGKQIVVVPKLIAVICYVIGTFFAAKSLLALKAFIEDSDSNPVTRFLALGSVSALLISLPYIIEVTANSLGAQNAHTASITSTSASFTDTGPEN